MKLLAGIGRVTFEINIETQMFEYLQRIPFLNEDTYYTKLRYTLSKCPGSHPILHRGLKLNSEISVGKYKKLKSSGSS